MKPLKPATCAKLGNVFPQKNSLVELIYKMPKVTILVNNIENLMSKLNVYTEDYGWSKIDIEYYGNPGQCYVCRETGHLAKTLPENKITKYW